jgi:ribonucleoside-diphosphate reductase beta chain
MYSRRRIIKAMIANNILEAIMFYAGFVWFWFLGTEMKGSAQMISFIARDERTHVLLFRQILTSTLKAYPKIGHTKDQKLFNYH